MLYYLHLLDDPNKQEWFDFLRLFQFGTFRAAGACLTAFLISLLLGEKVILKLTSLKVGQPIRTADEVHKLAELHGGKVGTPTMGGILIVAAVLFSVFLWAKPMNPFIAALVFVTFGTAILGFIDDYKKVTKKTSDGVSGKTKLIVQLVVAFVAVLFSTSTIIKITVGWIRLSEKMAQFIPFQTIFNSFGCRLKKSLLRVACGWCFCFQS